MKSKGVKDRLLPVARGLFSSIVWPLIQVYQALRRKEFKHITTMPLPRIASLFFSALILVPAVHSTCYLPNGKMYPNWSKYSEWQVRSTPASMYFKYSTDPSASDYSRALQTSQIPSLPYVAPSVEATLQVAIFRTALLPISVCPTACARTSRRKIMEH